METKRILIGLILLIMVFSCKKMEFKKDISGTWQFVGSGNVNGLYKSKTWSHLQLKKNNQYCIYNYDTLKTIGAYSLYESGYHDQDYYEPYYLNFKGPSNLKIGFPFNKDLDISIINDTTMIFSERNISDGPSYYFTKN